MVVLSHVGQSGQASHGVFVGKLVVRLLILSYGRGHPQVGLPVSVQVDIPALERLVVVRVAQQRIHQHVLRLGNHHHIVLLLGQVQHKLLLRSGQCGHPHVVGRHDERVVGVVRVRCGLNGATLLFLNGEARHVLPFRHVPAAPAQHHRIAFAGTNYRICSLKIVCFGNAVGDDVIESICRCHGQGEGLATSSIVGSLK